MSEAQQIDPSLGEPSPHTPEASHKVLELPYRELRPIGYKSREDLPFLTSRKVRPDTDYRRASNYHNVPILGFGVEFGETYIELSTPNASYINDIIQQHNPGGFIFITEKSEGFQNRADFLEGLSRKEFPISSDRRIVTSGPEDNYNLYFGRDGLFGRGKEARISLYEHDMIDHLGLFAIPAKEVDKFARVAQATLENFDDLHTDHIVATLDRLLDNLSDYAISGDLYEKQRGSYKDFVWYRIRRLQTRLNCLLSGMPASDIDENYTASGLPTLEKIEQKFVDKGHGLTLDRLIIDQKVAEMQHLPKQVHQDPSNTVGSVVLTGSAHQG